MDRAGQPPHTTVLWGHRESMSIQETQIRETAILRDIFNQYLYCFLIPALVNTSTSRFPLLYYLTHCLYIHFRLLLLNIDWLF